ncbi:MAG: FAD-binding oxidoreductase [Cyanobacteria bacterium J06634_6]
MQRCDERWAHKWGFADTQFIVNPDRTVELTGDRYPLCGRKISQFIPHIEAGFGAAIDWDNPQLEVAKPSVPPPQCYAPFCDAITAQFPSRCYSTDDGNRLRHSHGQSMVEEVWKVLYGKLERIVDLVFYCESEADAQTLIRLAVEHDVCLVPYGGGTSVSGALVMPTTEPRMIVAVNTRRMNNIEWIDTENGRACVQAGTTGKQLEAALKPAGFTSGHEPDSRELSTVGGWIATNASGMKKNRYGNIEDIVETITLVTPTGVLSEATPYPRASVGMPLQRLFFGSEGNLGLITKAIIRIRPLPEEQKYGSLLFPNMSKGTAFLHELSRINCVPASIRLVDNAQFQFGQMLKPEATGLSKWGKRLQKIYLGKVLKFSSKEVAAATLVLEGSRQEVAYQQKTIYALAKQYGGLAGGASNGRGGYLLTYAIAYIGQFLMRFHIVGETFETTVAWSDISRVTESVDAELKAQHRAFNLPGCPYLSYRITQVYPTGVCIYFTMGLYMKGVEDIPTVFGKIYTALRQVIVDCGGSVSHHHGVGKMRQRFVKQLTAPANLEMLKTLKKTSDPSNVFGIGNTVFGPDED